LRRYVDVVGQMGLPAELDTGEVVKTDTEYLVGASKKTAYGGVRQIRKKLDLDLPLRTVKRVDDGLCHLGSGLSYLGDDHLLAVEDLRGYRFLDRYNIVWVPPEEEDIGGNVVTLADGCIIAPVNAPETVALLRDMGRDVETVDTSEYTKADGHISCLSINIQ
jgi:N-dimethylarginine dimethylaminohydrolase